MVKILKTLFDIIIFDISDVTTSFPESQFNGTIFFHINVPHLCHNLT